MASAKTLDLEFQIVSFTSGGVKSSLECVHFDAKGNKGGTKIPGFFGFIVGRQSVEAYDYDYHHHHHYYYYYHYH